MSPTERRIRMREILNGTACVHPASVTDPLSARAAEEIGFETIMMAGSTASLAVLGAPDIILLTLTEFADQCRRICRVSPLPMFVDADHGYGNAMNVKRTVEELETAGIAALSIEDTVLPQPFGDGHDKLISIEEGVGKMKAALAGRQDDKLVIAGRTTVAAGGSVDDTIRRVTAYQEAGVDAIFLASLKNREQLEKIAPEIGLPIILGSVPAELRDRDYLAGHGVRVSLQGHQTLAAAVEAYYRTLKALRDGTPVADVGKTITPGLVERLSRAEQHDSWRKDWLK